VKGPRVHILSSLDELSLVCSGSVDLVWSVLMLSVGFTLMLVRLDLLDLSCNLCDCKLLMLQVFTSFHVVIGVPYFIYVSFCCVGGGAGFFGHL